MTTDLDVSDETIRRARNNILLNTAKTTRRTDL